MSRPLPASTGASTGDASAEDPVHPPFEGTGATVNIMNNVLVQSDPTTAAQNAQLRQDAIVAFGQVGEALSGVNQTAQAAHAGLPKLLLK
jgi:hypothetical protein